MSLAAPAGARLPHALVMMLLIICAAVVLTWIVPSGRCDRTPAGLVIPGSYHRLPKEYRLGLQHSAAPTPDREMAIDVLIPSTSGKAAVTMPILGPIGQLAGVSGQVVVQAFIFGNGLTNAVTPTSGMLLAYLAAGKVSYGEWLRFVLPLFLLLTVLSLAALAVAVVIGL